MSNLCPICLRHHACCTVQTLPVERGRGMDQPGMRAAEQRLAAGDWVHIFPEGTRSPDGRSLGKLRCGPRPVEVHSLRCIRCM